jgi:phosphoglycerate dehydrogenase-like enzyme
MKICVSMPAATRAMVLADADLRRLAAAGDLVILDPGEDDLAELGTADIVVTGWGSPRLTDIAASGRTRFVAHTAGSIKFLGLSDFIEQGKLRVSQAASQIAPAVAEFVLAVALAYLRRLTPLNREVRGATQWAALRANHLGEMLCDQKVGVVGAGYVGRLVIRHLRAFGAEVHLYDPYVSDTALSELGAYRIDLAEMFRACDIVTLHAPNTPETNGMIGAELLHALRPGTLLINTARAGIVDSAALLKVLREGRIHAALDVFDKEPLQPDDPLYTLPNVTLYPHASGHSRGSYLRQGSFAVDEVLRFIKGEVLLGEITLRMLATMA